MTPTPERWGRHARPLVIGHRGAPRAYTENTMPAFEQALAEGADGIELDVQLCRTGEVVVFHDEHLLRLGGRSERLRDLGWNTLRSLDLLGGGRMPLLDEVLGELPDTLINVEIKSPMWSLPGPVVDRVAALIVRHRAWSRVCISSFHPAVVMQVKRTLAAVPVGALFAADQIRPLSSGKVAELMHPAAVHPEHVLIDTASMTRWRTQGVWVNTYTVDDPARMRELAMLGVDAIITNLPGLARETLGNR